MATKISCSMTESFNNLQDNEAHPYMGKRTRLLSPVIVTGFLSLAVEMLSVKRKGHIDRYAIYVACCTRSNNTGAQG